MALPRLLLSVWRSALEQMMWPPKKRFLHVAKGKRRPHILGPYVTNKEMSLRRKKTVFFREKSCIFSKF